MPGPSREIEENKDRIEDAIADACRRSGRHRSDVRLVAITKTVPVEVVREAREAGILQFGENYVKELATKREAAPDATWHYVGALQSHTAHRVADLADVVHSLGPGRAVRRLAGRASSVGKTIPGLVQVDSAGRGTGVRPEGVGALLEELEGTEGLEPVGLMTLPPEPRDPEDSRPHFRRLRELRDSLSEGHPGLRELSMGMSLDFQVAVEEGATMLRIGTALFGARP